MMIGANPRCPDGPSGHLGFAPIIVRPVAPVQRVAVVLPTTTWQAYNYYDRNGDGFGDTWYSLFSQKRINLARPHLRRGDEHVGVAGEDDLDGASGEVLAVDADPVGGAAGEVQPPLVGHVAEVGRASCRERV